MKTPCIAVCVPSYDSPKFRHVVAASQLDLPRPVHLFRTHALDIVTARNELTRQALSVPEVTHVLFMDDDMVPPPQAVRSLLKHDVFIVGGLCHTRRGPSYHPILGKLYPAALGLEAGAMGFWYDHPRGELLEVDATGGAFLLIKRDVFEAVGPNPWTPADGLSEDFSFCQRARNAGFNVHVDPEVDVGHIAEVVIDRAMAKKLRTNEWAPWVPHEIAQHVSGPQATIVIPTYNQRIEYLHAAIYSALCQTVSVEVIVVDDGSDVPVNLDSLKAAHPNLLLVRHEENRGIAAALNTGIDHMNTQWFCWLSSDDLLDPRKVNIQLQATAGAGALASFHDYSVIEQGAARFPKYAVGPTFNSRREQAQALTTSCCINGSTVMIHVSALERVVMKTHLPNGPRPMWFDENLRYSQDWELWLRLHQAGIKWHHVAATLGTRREGGNLTERIEADPEKKARRDQEDEGIRQAYRFYEI